MMFRITNFDIRMQSEESSSMSLNTKLDDLGFTFHARLDESSGTSAADRINSNSGVIGGSPTLGATGGGTEANDGIEFSGASRQYVSWSGSGAVDTEVYDNNVRSDRALFIAFETDSNSDAQLLYQQGGINAGFGIYLNGGGLLYLNMTNGDASNFSASHAQLSTSTWYVTIIIQDDSTNEIIHRLYDENGLVSSNTIDITSVTSEAMGESLVSIGTPQGDLEVTGARFRNHANAQWLSNEKHWDGVIDEVAYKAGGAISITEADELAKAYFVAANTDAPRHSQQPNSNPGFQYRQRKC